jgi:hypothetical protein
MRPAKMATDALAVLVFVAIGRAVHAHGLSVVGLVSTGWPFLSGLAAGWVTVAVRRRDGASLLDGGTVLVSTVGLGMILRVVAGQGTAVAFVFVTLGFLGVAMLGWRLALTGLRSRRAGAGDAHVPPSQSADSA